MRSRRSGKVRRGWLYLGLFILAFGIRIWMPGPVESTTDEPLWLMRSAQFSKAVSTGDLHKATAWGAVPGIDYPTMPGVTTMWAGTAGRAMAKVGHRVGVNAAVPEDPLASSAVLRWSKVMVALLVSCGLVVFTWSSTRLVGRTAGFLAGLLCAIEPWFVGHSFLLHTDALVTVFGTTSIIAMAAAFRDRTETSPSGNEGQPPSERILDTKLLVVSAVTGGLAIATKMNGLVIVGGGIGVVALTETLRRLRHSPIGERWRTTWRLGLRGLCWLAGLLVVFAVVWPAVWVQPVEMVEHLRESVAHPVPIAAQYFMGTTTTDPSLWFYPVALGFRLSPWLLLGFVAAVVVGLIRLGARVFRRPAFAERLPRLPWVLVASLVPYAIVVAGYTRVYDRYALVFVPMFALVTATFVADVAARFRRRRSTVPRPWLIAGGLSAILIPALYVATRAPYEISYVDPLLGGQKTAEGVMMLGWGEGSAPLGKELAGREAGRCDAVRLAAPNTSLIDAVFPCGHRTTLDELGVGDYVLLNINQVQRGVTPAAISDRYGLELESVDATVISGVPYSTLYRVTRTFTPTVN